MELGKIKSARLPRAWLAAVLLCSGLAAGTVGGADEAAVDGGFSPELPVYLYFADPDRPVLTAEERPPMTAADPAAFCRALLDALIQGSSGTLSRTVPADARVRAVFVADQTAYVDFSPEIRTSHPGGIDMERLTVYAIVHTVVLNLDGVDRVKILIDGRDAETLAGHIDIRFPLSADMLIVR